VDIGGHPPFPTGSKQFSGNFGNLLFLAGFNFRDHFEGLNEGFLRSRFSMIAIPWEVVPLWFWVSNHKWEIHWDYVPCTLCLIQL
jgi:hypothetical protein